MSGISNSDHLAAKREELFINLYKEAFPAVAKYISRRGGSFDEAKDIFHDALVIYYENKVSASIKNDIAWLVGTAKNLWLKKYRENCQNMPLDNIDVTLTEDESSPSAQRLM
ncbi:MAG: polymerase subunit sigma-70, partial [Mucilaginibacter sp.]|nr:polymerase subunit sigma-70 [Mucilaginibacter sp.]